MVCISSIEKFVVMRAAVQAQSMVCDWGLRDCGPAFADDCAAATQLAKYVFAVSLDTGVCAKAKIGNESIVKTVIKNTFMILYPFANQG